MDYLSFKKMVTKNKGKILIKEIVINDTFDVNRLLKTMNKTPFIALINVKKLRKNKSEFKIEARSSYYGHGILIFTLE